MYVNLGIWSSGHLGICHPDNAVPDDLGSRFACRRETVVSIENSRKAVQACDANTGRICMSRTLLALMLLLEMASVSTLAVPLPNQAAPDPFLVERGRAGEFEVGMEVDEVRRLASVAFDATFPEGMYQMTMRISIPGFTSGPAIVASIWPSLCYAQVASNLRVVDPRYHTARGIHVGSTLADIRRTLPSAKIENFNADGSPVETRSEVGISFLFAKATESRDDERVTGLLLYEVPYERLPSVRCPSDADRLDVWQAAFDAVIKPKTAVGTSPPVLVLSQTSLICESNPSVKPPPFVGCIRRDMIGPALLSPGLLASFSGHNSGYDFVPPLNGAAAIVAPESVTRLSPDSRGAYSRVVFSAPGFDRGKAAVFVSYSCGNQCGEGTLVMLEYKPAVADTHFPRGHWAATSQRVLVVS